MDYNLHRHNLWLPGRSLWRDRVLVCVVESIRGDWAAASFLHLVLRRWEPIKRWASVMENPDPVKTFLKEGDARRMLAFTSTLIFSAFLYTFAPELLVVTGREMRSPRRNLLTAARHYFHNSFFSNAKKSFF